MPELVKSFDPSVPGNGYIGIGAMNPGTILEIANESIYLLSFDVPAQGTYIILPFTVDRITLTYEVPNLSWTALTSLNIAASTAPISTVYIIRYTPNEKPTGNYPFALPRMTNIGGGLVGLAGGIDSGVTFPINQLQGTVFYRTDVFTFFYLAQTDGVNPDVWLSIDLHNSTFNAYTSVDSSSLSEAKSLIPNPYGLTPYLISYTVGMNVELKNDGTNYHQVNLAYRDFSSLTGNFASDITQGNTINTWYYVDHAPALNPVNKLTGARYFQLRDILIGTPGNMAAMVNVNYRWTL